MTDLPKLPKSDRTPNVKDVRVLWKNQIVFLGYTDGEDASIRVFCGYDSLDFPNGYAQFTVPFKELQVPNPLFKNSKKKKKRDIQSREEILRIIGSNDRH